MPWRSESVLGWAWYIQLLHNRRLAGLATKILAFSNRELDVDIEKVALGRRLSDEQFMCLE
jgi:hypothetical protein